MRPSQLVLLLCAVSFGASVYGCPRYLPRFRCVNAEPSYHSFGDRFGEFNYGNVVRISVPTMSPVAAYGVYHFPDSVDIVTTKSTVTAIFPDAVLRSFHNWRVSDQAVAEEVGKDLDSIGYETPNTEFVLLVESSGYLEDKSYIHHITSQKPSNETWEQWFGQIFSGNTYNSGGSGIQDPGYGYSGGGGYNPWANVPVVSPDWGPLVTIGSLCGPGGYCTGK